MWFFNVHPFLLILWVCWVFVAAWGLFLVGATLVVIRSLTAAASLAMVPRPQGTGSAIVGHGLSCPEAGETSLDQRLTCVTCIDTWTINHQTSREAPLTVILTFGGNELVYLSPWMSRGLSNWVYFGWCGFLPTPHLWAWATGSSLYLPQRDGGKCPWEMLP